VMREAEQHQIFRRTFLGKAWNALGYFFAL
jgi:hypothetical protein